MMSLIDIFEQNLHTTENKLDEKINQFIEEHSLKHDLDDAAKVMATVHEELNRRGLFEHKKNKEKFKCAFKAISGCEIDKKKHFDLDHYAEWFPVCRTTIKRRKGISNAHCTLFKQSNKRKTAQRHLEENSKKNNKYASTWN